MKIKEEGIVLLKNKDNTLPLNTGENAKVNVGGVGAANAAATTTTTDSEIEVNVIKENGESSVNVGYQRVM